MTKKRKPTMDAFDAAMQLLVSPPCQACMGRRWVLGRRGKTRCWSCGGSGLAR